MIQSLYLNLGFICQPLFVPERFSFLLLFLISHKRSQLKLKQKTVQMSKNQKLMPSGVALAFQFSCFFH